jgi:sugar lactone lactonase YvrE
MINGLCFDNNGFIYVTDLNQCAIFFKQANTAEQSPLIENVIAKEYDGKPFKGPNSLCFNKDDNVIYFTDSGNFETASMSPFDCSLYSIDLETRVLKQILTNLSFVYDVCYDSANSCIYLAETFMNRILRLKQNEDGIYITSIFYQFNGRIGPSALTVDENGNLYVARYEYSPVEFEGELEADGLISVINKDGIMIGELTLPELPEITGLYISPKKRENLYVTERNSTGIFRIKISSFTIDLDKYEEKLEEINKNLLIDNDKDDCNDKVDKIKLDSQLEISFHDDNEEKINIHFDENIVTFNKDKEYLKKIKLIKSEDEYDINDINNFFKKKYL